MEGLGVGTMSKQNVGKRHWGLYVNRKLNTYSANPTRGSTEAREPVDNTVHPTLVDNSGTPLSEPTRSKVVPVMVDR